MRMMIIMLFYNDMYLSWIHLDKGNSRKKIRKSCTEFGYEKRKKKNKSSYVLCLAIQVIMIVPRDILLLPWNFRSEKWKFIVPPFPASVSVFNGGRLPIRPTTPRFHALTLCEWNVSGLSCCSNLCLFVLVRSFKSPHPHPPLIENRWMPHSTPAILPPFYFLHIHPHPHME